MGFKCVIGLHVYTETVCIEPAPTIIKEYIFHVIDFLRYKMYSLREHILINKDWVYVKYKFRHLFICQYTEGRISQHNFSNGDINTHPPKKSKPKSPTKEPPPHKLKEIKIKIKKNYSSCSYLVTHYRD